MARSGLVFGGLVLAALLVIANADVRRGDDEWKPPKWYRGKDGPIFDVMKTSGFGEQRFYRPSKWVQTNITNVKFDDALSQGTGRLDAYWKGENDQDAKVADTVPTFVLAFPAQGADKTLDTRFSVEYFLPHELFDAPPTPKASEVNIITIEGLNVWVKVFGGYAHEQDVRDQAWSFLDELKANGVSVHEDVFGIAQYDDPVHLINRHNEIWFWEKPAPSLEAIMQARNSLQSRLVELKDALTRRVQKVWSS